MRRICFDIESDYFSSGQQRYLRGPEHARAVFQGKAFRFDAATAFLHETGESWDFTDHLGLFNLLLQADELITFNGRTCDLIVLESLLGEEPMRELWNKPHHDLKGWQGQSLTSSAARALPAMIPEFESLLDLRRAKLTVSNEFIRERLAKSFRDAWFTLKLFELYLVSGESAFTFLNDGEPS